METEDVNVLTVGAQIYSSVQKPLKASYKAAYRSPRHQGDFPSFDSAGSQKAQPYQETLNARSKYTNSQDDGQAEHRINQYLIKQEIGRGSFGSVHLAVDQYGTEYVRTSAVERFPSIPLLWLGKTDDVKNGRLTVNG